MERDVIDIDAQPPAKLPRLADDTMYQAQGGGNYIEIDGKRCTHEVAWPPGQMGSSSPPINMVGPPAREYPFKIDPFQQTAINCLEAGHSVLVAAHTSAGKTVVAEYAFAMALRDKTRVVYTSPLKALSNQKYRELSEEFHDVGLMTGDVTINENASCLVMTTEILRSMLYRGSEVVREVQLIVYDEIHYLRDKERGVVWEESIILAPKTARFAFLSATIPNAREFAEWIARTHGSPCHVVYTDYRPTPLQHYIFPAGTEGLYMVVDERSTFREDNFEKAIEALNDAAADGGKNGKKGGGRKDQGAAANGEKKGENSDIFKIVKMIMERNYDPVIIFSFSKRECETLANNMVQLDLTDDAEKELIRSIFESAVACLSQEDRRLQQISEALPMLLRGIGVHHSGLLPIIKESIEIMFGEGLLKALFATETFSTGLNMPAKTVVFTNVRKFDGGNFRWISSGEYIQMSGRAGRRGLDDRGIVILMLDSRLEPAVAKEMIKGAPDKLNSAFHLGYNMLLSLLRVEGADPEGIMRQSFHQFQMERSLPQLQRKVAQLEEQRDAVVVPDANDCEGYLELLKDLARERAKLREFTTKPKHALPFLQPGRLVRILPRPFDPTRPVPSFADLVGSDSGPGPASGSGAQDASTDGDGALSAKARTSGVASTSAPGAKLAAAAGGTARSAAAAGGTGNTGPLEVVDGGVWGAVVNFERIGKKEDGEEADGAEKGSSKLKAANFIVDVLVNCVPQSGGDKDDGGGGGGSSSAGRPDRVRHAREPGQPEVVTFSLAQVDRLSSVRVYLHKDLRPTAARQAGGRVVAEALQRLEKQFGSVPLLDLEQDLRITDKDARKKQAKIESYETLLQLHSLATHPDLYPRLATLQHKQELGEAVAAARREAKAAAGLVLKDELKARQRVLRRLGFVNSDGKVTIKGQLAAEIQTADELVLTELIFNGAFSHLSAQQFAAACACFVWSEKSDEGGPKLSEELLQFHATIRDAARRVGKVSQDAKMQLDLDEYINSFSPDIMEIVHAWAGGARFAEIMKMSKIFEGSLVRAIRRLEELMRQLSEGLRHIGEMDLAATCEAGRERIKRDIIFAASLYL